jgi:hypothetical protein
MYDLEVSWSISGVKMGLVSNVSDTVPACITYQLLMMENDSLRNMITLIPDDGETLFETLYNNSVSTRLPDRLDFVGL